MFLQSTGGRRYGFSELEERGRHLGFQGRKNSGIIPKMNSTVRSIPLLDFRGASIAALKKFEMFVEFHHKTLLFGHFFLKNRVDVLVDKYSATQSASHIEWGLPGI